MVLMLLTSAMTLFGSLGQLQLRGWFPPWIAWLLGGLAAAAIVVLYIKEAGRLGLPTRLALATVRAGIVLLVAWLLQKPVWVREDEERKPRPIAILVDVSQSMDNKDPRPNTADQGRVAIATGHSDPTSGLPDASALTALEGQLPDKPKRIEVAAAALTNARIALFPRLATLGPLEVYTFGTRRTGRSPLPETWIKNVAADEPRTALVEAAFEMINREDTEAPAAIVLVTDGRENAGPKSIDDLARECSRRKIPIFVYGVGSSSFGQLQTAFGSGAADKSGGTRVAADVDAPNTLFVDDTASIPVRYTVKGLSEGVATIELKYGDRKIPEATRRESFSLTPEEMRQGKTFATIVRFVPTKLDADSKKQEYSATVTVTAGTGATADVITNTISRAAQVVNRKLKVLVVDSLPRRDFQFLQRALLRDRRVEAKFYLTEGDKAAMRSGAPWMIEFSREVNGILTMDRKEFRQLLFEFDLLILGDVPGKFFTREHQEVIKEFVTEGAGLIHIAGRWHAPAAWAPDKGSPGARLDTNPIADILPVEFEAVRFPIQALDNPVGFVPMLAPAASRTQIVSLDDDPTENAELWGKPGPTPVIPNPKQLKPLYWYYPVTKVKPAADVFLIHPTARTPSPDNKPMPLLVGHHYGKGYVLFVGFDDTWRWRFNTQEKIFGRFWTQAVYTAGVPRIVGTRKTQLSTNTPAPVFGEAGEYHVRVFNESFLPSTAEVIEGTLEKTDADTNDKDKVVPVIFRKVPGVDGEYVVTVPYNRVGQFKLSVDPKNKSPATLNFPVNYRDNHELAPAALDEEPMRKLCDATGGKFYREEDLVKLPNDVKGQSARFYHKEEILLWNQWMMIGLICLLTLEWFLRKFNGLS
jgi:hypothetical protein